MIEISFVGIKPEAQHYERQIIERMTRERLLMRKRKLVFITEDRFELVWGKIRPFPPRVCRKVERQLLYRYVVIVLFEGEAAISRIVEIVGPKANAPRNKPHQLRYIYGDHHSRRLHANGIHRPKTAKEVLEHLAALGVGSF